MICPTVGRVVWFRPNGFSAPGFVYHGEGVCGPLAAIVTHVWHDRMVNLVVFDSNGSPLGLTSVQLLQDGDTPHGGYYCEWMPYQKGQAAKTEELERKAS